MPETAALVPVSSIDRAIEAATQLGKEGVEVLKELFAIDKARRADAAREAYYADWAAFRAEMPVIDKVTPGMHGVSHVGTRTKGMYAPLDAIARTLDPIASRHGFSYRFDRESADGREWIVCIVSHEKGHEVRSRYPVAVDKGPGRNDIQAVASGETYARRYALTAAFAITTADPDDDGEAAGVRSEGGATITDEQAANLHALFDEIDSSGAEERRCLAALKIKTLREMPARAYANTVKVAEGKRRS